VKRTGMIGLGAMGVRMAKHLNQERMKALMS
jgi:3-hydroxyisobutyrate dehydrogenase-like beta-hydroxyacid dehydrogenase